MKNKMRDLYDWAESVFKRIGLELAEVADRPSEWGVRIRVKDMEMKLGVSMASMDGNLNLTDDEHKKMAEFLDSLI